MSAVLSLDEPPLRAMRLDDLPQVMAIEKTIYPFPWSEGIFRDCLRVGYFCMVYDGDDGLQGYGVMSVAADECHILNIGIHPVYHRRGRATRLLKQLLDTARHYRARIAFLEVRASNRNALQLYDKLGFGEIGVRANYYPGKLGREDALILAKSLF